MSGKTHNFLLPGTDPHKEFVIPCLTISYTFAKNGEKKGKPHNSLLRLAPRKLVWQKPVVETPIIRLL